MIREEWEFVGFVLFLVLIVALAWGEAEHFMCHPGDGAAYIGHTFKLYGC
jgi:hypothetical protein